MEVSFTVRLSPSTDLDSRSRGPWATAWVIGVRLSRPLLNYRGSRRPLS